MFLSVRYFCFCDASDDAVGRVLIKPVDDVKLGQVINMLAHQRNNLKNLDVIH